MNTHPKRYEQLLQECQHQRYELIASGAAGLARLPSPRNLARWMRFARSLLRVIHQGETHARQ
jgi:hypothetical protein